MTAKTEPTRADGQLRSGERSGLGIAEQMSDELTDLLPGHLI
jgi:hypothetical protein